MTLRTQAHFISMHTATDSRTHRKVFACTECYSISCNMLYALDGGTTKHAMQGCNASAVAQPAEKCTSDQ